MTETAEEQQRAGNPAAESLPPSAARALAEAAARRKARAQNVTQKEVGGRGGPDPARYGDWESNGIAHDF